MNLFKNCIYFIILTFSTNIFAQENLGLLFSDSIISISKEDIYEKKYDDAIKKLSTISELDDNYLNAQFEIASSYFDQTTNEIVAEFISTYKIDGNTIVIENLEYYTKVNFPLDIYNDYVKVINAAADFNKIKLVIEKK